MFPAKKPLSTVGRIPAKYGGRIISQCISFDSAARQIQLINHSFKKKFSPVGNKITDSSSNKF